MKVVIIGAGGFGREVLALIRNINRFKQQFDVVGFIDDGIEKNTVINSLPVLGPLEDVKQIDAQGIVIAIANPRIRKDVYQRFASLYQFPNVIDPTVTFLDVDRTKMGIGNVICAGTIFTTNIVLGDFNIINLACTIGHDASMKDFCAIMPGVNISGGATLEEGVYVGTGAKLIKATTLGSYSTVGAGAVVDADIDANQTVVGVPARPIKAHS